MNRRGLQAVAIMWAAIAAYIGVACWLASQKLYGALLVLGCIPMATIITVAVYKVYSRATPGAMFQ